MKTGLVVMFAAGLAVSVLGGCEKPTSTTSTAPATTPAPSTTPGPSKTHAVNPDAKPDANSDATPQTKPAPAPTPAPATTPPATTPPATPTAAPKEPAVVTPPNTPTKQELPGGLILEDLVVGTGAECKPNATVTIHYRGTLENGEEFDSSHKRGRPATFPLGSLIKGWQQGIPGMKVGGKRKLTIPYQLAYGEAGRPPTIPPKATLIFEIEMFDTK